MTGAVFPLGHYAGARPTPAGDEQHVVRVGRRLHRLTADGFGVWVLAHGTAEVGKGMWPRADILALAAAADLPAAGIHVDDLLARGLLAHVPTGPGDRSVAVAFARTHRMHALCVGMGNSPDAPDLHAVGVPGIGITAMLDPDSYELWQWGGLAPTLWHSCEVRGAVSTQLGDPLDAEGALDQILGDMRHLIAHNCVYLDVAAPLPFAEPMA